MNYGLPYKGSKNFIAEWVVSYLPPAENFVDLFFGGGAITHAAMCSGKYKRYVCNDLDKDMPRLFADTVQGKFHNETRWISRDDFFKLKDTDPYVRICWSFGNNARTYLYSREIEPWKKALHYARIFGDYSLLAAFGICSDGSFADIKAHHEEYKLKYIQWYVKDVWAYSGDCRKFYESLERLQRLQRLERLERLQSLQSDTFITSGTDYQEVNIPANSVVYCDPPYKDTDSYNNAFDHERFYNWLRNTDRPVWVSEYQMPPDFVCIGAKVKNVLLSQTNNSKAVEKLFIHEKWANKVWKPILF